MSNQYAGNTCKCKGGPLQFGPYQGAGSCNSGYWIGCGSFCFVDANTCRDQVFLLIVIRWVPLYTFMIIIQKTDIMYSDAMCQVFLHAINMWVSCTPCPNQRNLPILQVEECPSASNSSRFGWLLSLLEWSVFELRDFFFLKNCQIIFNECFTK